MKLILLYLLTFTAGVFLAAQAGFNTQLGSILKQPILALIITSVVSLFLGSTAFLLLGKDSLSLTNIETVPWYLWFAGGLLSTVGIFLYLFTIPKLGISKVIATGLCGQLIFSIIAGKYGWLSLPIEPLSPKRLIGTFALIIGIALINSK